MSWCFATGRGILPFSRRYRAAAGMPRTFVDRRWYHGVDERVPLTPVHGGFRGAVFGPPLTAGQRAQEGSVFVRGPGLPFTGVLGVPALAARRSRLKPPSE